ncbi:MAG: hypothetical protein WA139_03400 [Candidatus Aenigmatarchaeota archaeon]
MIFQVNTLNNSKLSKAYEKSMSELDNFFKINWKNNRPNVFLVRNRKTINFLQDKKTENWLVGWVNGKDVYLLSDKTYEKESCHKYSNEEYFALLKHELAHCFSNMVSHFSQKPVWLLEGISIFLSGQNNFKAKPERLGKFIDSYDKLEKEVYLEAGFAVEFLVRKYGREKIIELMKKLKNSNSKEDFANLFKSVYSFELDYANFEVL